MIELESVYRVKGAVLELYDLLKEREPHQNISHKEMPTMEDHSEFFYSKPYLAWYLIKNITSEIEDFWEGDYVGAIYLSKQREIGIHLFKEFQGKGYGKEAVELLMKKWPGKFYANINPKNEDSIRFFSKLGAILVQYTYEIPSHHC